MADCVSCGTRLEEGTTKCPQCGATLARPGSFLQVCGWVTVCMSSIPLVVGVIAAQQQNYIPLGLGGALTVAGIFMVIAGRAKTASSPETTKPSPAPAAPPSMGGMAR
jgi:hypothetical protein